MWGRASGSPRRGNERTVRGVASLNLNFNAGWPDERKEKPLSKALGFEGRISVGYNHRSLKTRNITTEAEKGELSIEVHGRGGKSRGCRGGVRRIVHALGSTGGFCEG